MVARSRSSAYSGCSDRFGVLAKHFSTGLHPRIHCVGTFGASLQCIHDIVGVVGFEGAWLPATISYKMMPRRMGVAFRGDGVATLLGTHVDRACPSPVRCWSASRIGIVTFGQTESRRL
jgi:hypothetical protein